MLPGMDFSRTDKANFATNYAAVQNLITKSARQRDMIAQRVQGLAMGVPQPAAPPLQAEHSGVVGLHSGQSPGLCRARSEHRRIEVSDGACRRSAAAVCRVANLHVEAIGMAGVASGRYAGRSRIRQWPEAALATAEIPVGLDGSRAAALRPHAFRSEFSAGRWSASLDQQPPNELQQEINDAGGQPGGGAPAPKPPAMSPADITASLANAKAALAKHPDQPGDDHQSPESGRRTDYRALTWRR